MSTGVSLRRLLVFAGAIVFADTVFYAAIAPLLPTLSEEYSLSKAQAGMLQAAYPAGTLLASLPAGYLAATAGVRPTTIAALVLFGASSLGFAFADSALLLDLSRFIQGVAGAGTWAGAFAWLIAGSPRERRGEVTGAALGVGIAGAMFGPVLGGIASEAGREVVFAGVAVVAAGLATWAARMPALEPEGPPPPARLARAFTSGPVVFGMWLAVLPGLLFGALSVLAPLRLDELGVSAGAIAGTFLVLAAIEAVVSPVVGRVSDRRGRRGPVMVGLALSTLGAAALPWPDSDGLLIAVVAATGCLFGILWAPALAQLTDSLEDQAIPTAFAMAIMSVAWAVGQVSGSAGGGSLADATSDTVTFLALAGLCAASLAWLSRDANAASTRASPQPR